MPLQVQSLGPFIKGVLDTQNAALDGSGYLRSLRHGVYVGGGVLQAGEGSSVAITLMDDAGTPAEVTSVCEVVPFGSGVLAVAHSTGQTDAYLYRLDASLTGWYNLAGTFTASSTATPLATVLWASMSAAPVVHISEVNGTAHITCTNASDGTTASFATRVFNGTSIADLTADIDGAGGAETIYALGTFAFQQHRWMWGFGSSAVVATNYRPDLLRFGGPNGDTYTASGAGSFSVGHRVKSARETIVGVCVAGPVAYVGTTYSLWPIVGYGRDTWDKSKPLDDSYGFIGPKCAASANGTLYYWSPRGPMRVSGLDKPEPLWDRIPATVDTVVDPEKIICAYDPDLDQVRWFYRGTGVTANQLVCAYDVRRDIFAADAEDVGILVGCANVASPVTAPSATAAAGPAGAPTSAVTSGVAASSATASWTTGDATATTTVEYRQQGGSTYTTYTTLAAGTSSVLITGLASGVAYEWRARHAKNGQYSSYLGPVAGSQFTTTTSLAPPTSLTLTDVGPATVQQGLIRWTNSGESVSTEVYLDDVLKATVGEGESSYYVTVSETGSYTAKARHVRSPDTPSSYTAGSTATLTYGEGS